MRKRIRRDLTLLTVAFPIIFFGTLVSVFVIPVDLHLRQLLLATGYALFGVFFLIVAAVFSSLLKKPRFVLLSVNHSDPGLESNAAAERRTLVKGAREQLAIFLLVYAFPVLLLWGAGSFAVPASNTELVVKASVTVLLLSALTCFLLGYWVLTRSGVAAIDEHALDGLLNASVGVLPTKVRAGEAHSVLMDFNIAAASVGVTSPAGEPSAFESAYDVNGEKRCDQCGAANPSDASFCKGCGVPLARRPSASSDADPTRPHYEVELQAAGATVDGEKRCAIFEVPATCESIWNCSFPNAGIQVLHLLLKEVRPARAQIKEDAFVRHPLFTYMHNVHVEGRFTASLDNVVSMIGIIVTAGSVLITLRVFVP